MTNLAITSGLVGLTTCTRGGHEGRPDLLDHVVGDKYTRSLLNHAGAVPVPIVPAGDEQATKAIVDAIIPTLSGLVLTGSLSNVHPDRYNTKISREAEPFAPERDALTWALLDAAIARKMPILAICRGIQELNVYFGGTLHPRVHETAELADHRADPDAFAQGDTNAMYGPNHDVNISRGGKLSAICDGQNAMAINSLHWQGINELGDGLVVEATAEMDSLVEAVSIRDYDGFSLGVQWHPEFDADHNPASRAIFQAFGKAVTDFNPLENP